MNKPTENFFATRPTVMLELPLAENAHILHPEQVILKIDRLYHDVGAFCYALRADRKRKPGQSREVVLSSFLKQRPHQVRQIIKAFSSQGTDGGKRLASTQGYASTFKQFIDWADTNGLHDCLSGGDSTRLAYQAWVVEIKERYRRHELAESAHNHKLDYPREILEALTGLENLKHGVKKLNPRQNPNGGTDPVAQHDFARAVTLNQALFDGLCGLVLENSPFPFKLELPSSLGGKENHLWLFPCHRWYLLPYQWGAEREKLASPSWANDYEHGRLATVDEIWHRYHEPTPNEQRWSARTIIANAQVLLNAANTDSQHRVRVMLGMIAHNAFLFLFHANTGANGSPVKEIETDGMIDEETKNQGFRSIKYRAGGKAINLVVPVAFMPSLRRFMELRRHLLNGASYPHLFFTLGTRNENPPTQIGDNPLESQYRTLRKIDPQLSRMGSRKIRASVADYYQRRHDISVTAKILQNTEQTTQRSYDKGSATDHHEELSAFLEAVSESAKKQRVISIAAKPDAKPLDEGGRCDDYGHPDALAENVPVKPNCKGGQGCLFCAHRILVACDEDARKIASAAFVMEQVILGPAHEVALRPLIQKCDADLEKIAAFDNCRDMVNQARKDVYENGNLTPFFADKYQLFLELGVIA